MKVSQESLVDILDDAAPKLDHALKYGPINAHIGDSSRNLTAELIRRGGTCQPSSELLEMYLPLKGIDAKLQTREIYANHRGKQRYLGGHVVSKLYTDGGRMIDSTWQQYLCFVGLTAQKAQHDPSLVSLYPENTIALIEPKSTDFADSVAGYAHELDMRDAVPRIKSEHPFYQLLRDTTLDEKVNVYRNIWDLESYKPFSRRAKLSRELLRSAALMCQM